MQARPLPTKPGSNARAFPTTLRAWPVTTLGRVRRRQPKRLSRHHQVIRKPASRRLCQSLPKQGKGSAMVATAPRTAPCRAGGSWSRAVTVASSAFAATGRFRCLLPCRIRSTSSRPLVQRVAPRANVIPTRPPNCAGNSRYAPSWRPICSLRATPKAAIRYGSPTRSSFTGNCSTVAIRAPSAPPTTSRS